MKTDLKYQTLLFDFADVVSDMQGEVLNYRMKHPEKKEVIEKSMKRLDRLTEIMLIYGQIYFDMIQYKRKLMDREIEYLTLVEKLNSQQKEIEKLTTVLNAG